MYIVPKKFEGKRTLTVPVKLNEAEKAEIERISKLEDRPLGYVVRELMWRGWKLYEKDGYLRDVVKEQIASEPDLNSKDELLINAPVPTPASDKKRKIG